MSAQPPSQTASSSWKLTLAFVWGGELLSILTSSILQMGLIWHITLSTNSASMLSLASLSGFLPLALFGAIAGTIVDRLPLRRVLIGSDLFIACVGTLLALASLAGDLAVWMVIAALFLRAIGTAFYTPASQALTPQLAPPEYLVRLAGITQGMQSSGYIVGVAIAAVIYPIFGLTAMIALDVAGALIASAAVLAARIDLDRPDTSQGAGEVSGQATTLIAETKEGYRALKAHEGLFALVWCGFAFTLVFAPISALFPIMTLDHFGGSTTEAATAEIVFSIGMIAGSTLLATIGGHMNPIRMTTGSLVVFGVAVLTSGLLGEGAFTTFLIMSFLMGLSSPFYSGPQVALLQERIEPEYLGRVFGLYGTIMAWALPVGLVAPTLLADSFGAPTWFVGAGVLMLLLAAGMWAIPSIRALGRTEQGPAA